MSDADHDDLRRRVGWAGLIGGGLSVLVFFLFLAETDTFFGPTFLGGFFDAQAHAWLDGRWDAPSDAYFIERIAINGKYQMYWGPFPALLRVPILWVADGLTGDLTRLSLLAANLTLFSGVSRVVWQIRAIHRADRPGRLELFGLTGFIALLGLGSAILSLSATPWVYAEAILWGAAFAVWTLHFALAYLRHPTTRLLVLTSLVTVLGISSRVNAGMIGIAILSGVFVLQVLDRSGLEPLVRLGQRIASIAAVPSPVVRRRPAPTLLAIFVPIASLAYVNYSRFGTLFSIPFEKQDILTTSLPQRPAVLEETGGDLLGASHIPTNLFHYLRPDGINFDGMFPWVDFMAGPRVIGEVTREPENLSTSITATSGALVILAILGVAAIALPRFAARLGLDKLRVLRVPTLAALMSFGPTLMIPTVSERYKVDATAFLLIAGGAGLYALAAMLPRAGRLRGVTIAAVLVLGMLNIGTHLGLTFVLQNSSTVGETAETRADYLIDRVTWTERLGFTPSVDLHYWDQVADTDEPAVGGPDAILVVNDCEELRIAVGMRWELLALDDPADMCDRLGAVP